MKRALKKARTLFMKAYEITTSPYFVAGMWFVKFIYHCIEWGLPVHIPFLVAKTLSC